MGRMVDGSNLIYCRTRFDSLMRYVNGKDDLGIVAQVCAWCGPIVMLVSIANHDLLLFFAGLVFFVCGLWYLRDQ